ncbi:hypothetical protein ADU85_03485 [Clostridium botulinum]|uniref:Uncharacterized protein n=1 Tax=Clostridium botulinum TaxID=1491 RepID=A0A9Q1V118_CLOBO|nr:hypothetical protein [Clostridium botulinum]KOA77859.1 hypothetical protein ADU77_07185 [Clostridium botulinum]KOA89007.1 hypothetical protein ADU75_00345 [Clostridium botulinum]KOA89998.1 hypothetical protein ADU74_01680 [Clostridium botulinum]KOC37965.1 hypothetical protein ADU83_00845 [Clostridium botulinum]KOC39395.1 hypothetical protein ADU82_01740 [Clostridium botulinum]
MATYSNISSNVNNTSPSYVQVVNNGAFFASFDVTYQLEGEVYTNSSYEFGAGVTKRINIPSGATTLTVRIQIAQFIGVWSDVLTKIYPTSGEYCFQVNGTTFAPSCKEVNCGTGGNGGNGNQQPCCCCCCCCPCSTQSSNSSCCSPCSMTSNDYYSMDSMNMNSCVEGMNPYVEGMNSCVESMNPCVENMNPCVESMNPCMMNSCQNFNGCGNMF